MVTKTYAVTGAFGYSGKYITKQLLDKGINVITLTNSVNRENPFKDRVKVFPYNFNDPDRLTASLKGVSVLTNTYWVRFNHKDFNHDEAVANSRILFKAAAAAGVPRIVHVSIANPSEASALPYYRGKAQLEQAIKETRMSYAIIRPAVLFGNEDILINNIAWMLRHLPVMGIFGNGNYRLRPIHVEDLAKLMVEEAGKTESVTVNAVGPESFSYVELVNTIGEIIGVKKLKIHVPAFAGLLAGWALGILMKDTVITGEEIKGLMQGLLYVDGPPTGAKKLTEWLAENKNTIGVKYASELARRKDRVKAYDKL